MIAADDEGMALRKRISEAVADRLRSRGVRLDGRETLTQLGALIDALEYFETAVGAAGGDLMMDEPLRADAPIVPDHAAFALPARRDGEAVDAYIDRLAQATADAKARRLELGSTR